ncbi:MAG: DNA polymerase III subunit delta' [Vulcanimicrobiaceae bacterium]
MHGVTGTFDVVGARAALAFFGNLERARLAHGYLFTGPVGVGKKTFARRLAQSLVCETPKSTVLGYCDACPGCKLFTAGTHPDFVSAEGVVKIGKEGGSALHDDELSARDLVRELSLHGYRSAYRVVMLGDVAFATHEAANALLKFFEEPPKGVVVILTSSAPGSLLATIRSRMCEVAFSPLPAADVERVLVTGGVAPAQAHVAAEVALGSITRARAVLDEDRAGTRDASFAWFARAVRGEHADASFLRLDDRSLTGAEKRALVGELIGLVRVAARDWVALRVGGAGVPLLAADQRERIAALPSRDPRALVTVLAAIGETERLANTNVSAGLVVDHLRMQLAPIAPSR